MVGGGDAFAKLLANQALQIPGNQERGKFPQYGRPFLRCRTQPNIKGNEQETTRIGLRPVNRRDQRVENRQPSNTRRKVELGARESLLRGAVVMKMVQDHLDYLSENGK